MDDHSIFFAAIRDSSVVPTVLPRGLYDEYKKLYLNYITHHKNLIEYLNGQVQSREEPVYLFGAHIFTQFLEAFGLDTSTIVSVLDNDPRKQGRRLYGTRLMVQPPRALRGKEKPVVILSAGVYNQEIKDDILMNINDKTVFLEN